MNHDRFRLLRPLSATVLAAALLPAAGRAQTAPPADAPAAANSEPIKMETFTVTADIAAYHEENSDMATKIPMNLKDLSMSLQILNTAAIADRNALSLPDVFAYVVGAVQTQQAINGFSFRGFPNTGTFTQNIEFDGLMGATLKKGASSAANVDRLEFLKGPNGVLYGQMHPGGLLNIITKSPEEIPETTLRTAVGTYAGRYSPFGDRTLTDVTLDTTGPLGASRHLLYRLVIDAANSPASRPGDKDRAISVYPALTYQWNKGTYLTVKFESSQDLRRQDDGLVPIFTQGTAFGVNAKWTTAPLNTVYQDPSDTGRDRGDSASAYFQAALPGDWTLRVQTRSVWHTDYTRELTVNNAGVYTPKAQYATPTTTLKRQYNLQINGHRYNYFDANLYRAFGTERLRNTMLFGVGGGNEFSNNQRFAFGPNVTPAITLINPVLGQSAYPADGKSVQSQRNVLTSLGVYVSDQLKVGSRLHVSLGVRRDQQLAHGIDLFNPVKTPYSHALVKSVTGQAGIVYDLTSRLSSYASWSQSVVPNSVTSVDASGQSNFPAEKGQQYEGGLKFETPDHNFYTSLAAYFINRSNVLVATGTTVPATGQGIFRLDGQQHSEGVEWESEWHPMKNWQVQAGAAFGKAFVAASLKNPQTVGLDLTGAPRASGNLWTRYNVPTGPLKGLGGGLGVIYVGKAWAGDPTTALYYVLPGWTRVDAALYYKLRRYEFYLNVSNLFDRQYIASAQSAITLNPGEERKITFAVTTKF
jgi:iron complex outermembrane recepter protein